MAGSGRELTRVEGRLEADGWVYCSCGKKCGFATQEQVEFACPCGNRVTVSYDLLYLRNCQDAIAVVNNGIGTLQNIMQTMAAHRGQRRDSA